MKSSTLIILLLVCYSFRSFAQSPVKDEKLNSDTTKPSPALPEPYATKSKMNFSKVVGWPAGKTPTAPYGFNVTPFASGLVSPRWIYVAPNGDVLVALANTQLKGLRKVGADLIGVDDAQRIGKSVDQVILFRDNDKDGIPETKELFLESDSVKQPFGMLIHDGWFYVAGTDGLWRFRYKDGQTRISGSGEKILNLPAGGHNNHWTRNIILSRDKTKIYVSIGSGSNVAEHGMDNEVRRACILQINLDGSGEKVYATGLRNPVGMGWATGTNVLWTAVNERDELGDDLVPDYLTSIKEGAFYGWPYSYFGQNEDPRRRGERPDLVQVAVVPDVALGSHTASLGLAFYDQKEFPNKYHSGAFIGQHGSWNRSTLAGYKVVFVPFKNGIPSGPTEDFLTGFVANYEENEVYGRPVGIAILPDGAMLVADDATGTIWHIRAAK